MSYSELVTIFQLISIKQVQFLTTIKTDKIHTAYGELKTRRTTCIEWIAIEEVGDKKLGFDHKYILLDERWENLCGLTETNTVVCNSL